MIRKHLLLFAGLFVVAAGCGQTPPAPPFVDPISSNNSVKLTLSENTMKAGGSVTATIIEEGATAQLSGQMAAPTVTGPTPPTGNSTLLAVTVSGTGTQGSPFTLSGTLAGVYTVTVPLVGVTLTGNAKWGSTVSVAGGSSAVTTTADPYSGRFQVFVPLNASALNNLTVTAMDGSGTSQATAVTVTAPAATDPQLLTVTPADPNMPPTLQLQLAAVPPPGAQAAMINAGQALVYAYTATDQYGNQLQNPNVTVTSNMPSSSVGAVDTQYADASGNTWYQGSLINFVRSGTFTVAAHIAGTQLTSTQTIIVNPDPTSLSAVLTLTPNITQIANPINYKVVVVDAYGNQNAAALSRLSFSFAPVPTIAPTCLPGTCAAPTAGSGTISFATAGIFQVSASFSGAPAVTGASQFVSVINAPIPPTLTILTPQSTDVDGAIPNIAVQLQIAYANATNNSVTFIATGAFGQSGVLPGLGQNVCAGGPPCILFNLNPANSPLAPTQETLLIVATDGTTGASITKSVTFTIDRVKDITAPGRNIVLAARGGMFNTPMGLTTLPANNNLYVADAAANSVFQISLASAFPVTPANGNLVNSTFNAPSDVQLRPNGAALGTYPPAAYQGLYTGSTGAFNFQAIDPTNTTVSSFSAFTGIRTSSYGIPVMIGATNIAAHLFLARPGNRIEVADPVSGADLTGGNPISMNGAVTEPWGVTSLINGMTSIRLISANGGNNTVSACELSGMPNTWQTVCNMAANLGILNPGGGTNLRGPRAVAFSATKKLYVVSSGNAFPVGPRVLSYDLTTYTCGAGGCACSAVNCAETLVASGFILPNGITFDSAGNMYVSDQSLKAVVQIPPGATPF